MRIEDITELRIKKAEDGELRSLRTRIILLYDKYFHGNSKESVTTASTGKLDRKDFLKKYKMLIKEMDLRDHFLLEKSSIDQVIFKQIFLGIDVPSLGDIPIVNDYVLIGGSYIKNPKKVDNVDIIIRDLDENRDEEVELKIEKVVKSEIKKDPRFVYAKGGTHSSYIPLFDLILRAKEQTKKVKIKEDIEKAIDVKKWLTVEQKKELKEENEKIKENEKKPEAKKPHEFKQAKFTHPNGHPRCLVCGDEERIGKVCNMPDKWYDKNEWDDEEAWEEERKKLKEEGVIKIYIEKPEETDDFIRIPVGPECDVTATIDIDEEKGITALYCGKIKRVRTFIFPKDKGWTMAKAKKWVKDHKDSMSKYLDKIEKRGLRIEIKSSNEKEYIVGGIVTVANQIDTQGDVILKEEVWKGMKSWMLKGGKVKVMHGGFPVDIKVVECYQADEEHHKGGTGSEHLIKKGDWWISLYLGATKKTKAIFQDVLDGKINGFSIGGMATV